jgi:hypothetical protein
MDDPLSQLCRIRDEILKLVTERLAAEMRCGVGRSSCTSALLSACSMIASAARFRVIALRILQTPYAELTTFDGNMLSPCHRPDIEMQIETIVTVNGVHAAQMSQISN